MAEFLNFMDINFLKVIILPFYFSDYWCAEVVFGCLDCSYLKLAHVENFIFIDFKLLIYSHYLLAVNVLFLFLCLVLGET